MNIFEQLGTSGMRVMENVISISMIAGILIVEGKIFPENSNTLNEGIIQLAVEFEETFSDEEIDYNYIGKIDEFAKIKLLAFYGVQ